MITAEQPITLEEVSKLRLQMKQDLLELARKKEDLYKRRKLWFWRPSPKQLTFFEHSEIKRRAGFCGNRFGKSELGVVEDCCWLIGYRPFFPEGHPLRTKGIPKHGVKGLIIAEDWDKVKEVFTNDESSDRLGKFFVFLPEDFIKKKQKNEKGVIDKIIISSVIDGVNRESVLYFDTVRSFKQNPQGAESSDWDFIHIDEPISKEHWVAISRGLIDRGGMSWQLLTPLKEVWMYNEMLENARTQPHLYWWFEATMDDNPTLSEEDKELYISQLPDDERQARRKGIPLAYGRLVFSQYDPDIHVIPLHPGWTRVNIPPVDHAVVYAIDTHPQTPHAGLFAALNKDGDIDIYEEIWQKCTILELTKLIKVKLADSRVLYQICEPAAWNEDQGSGFCYADMFLEQGIDFIPGSKQKETAVLLLQGLLKQRSRRLRIHARCKRLLWELMNHYFNKDNVPEDRNDHLLECFRRLVIHDNLTFYGASFMDKPQQFTSEKELHTADVHNDLSMGREELVLTKI